MIEDIILGFAVGNITGATVMMGTYHYYLKKQREKALDEFDMLGENFEDMSEEDLKLE